MCIQIHLCVLQIEMVGGNFDWKFKNISFPMLIHVG